MEIRNLAVFLGLCLLAVSQCSEARHSIYRREADDDIFAADEASDDDGTQNDELFEGRSPETLNQVPAVQASILTKPRSYEVKPGANVRLECAVDRDGDTVVQWYKGNDLYFMNTMKTYFERDIRRYSIAADSKDLLIENVELNDTGVFRCELVQATPVKIEHTLTVLEPPSISRFTATNNGNLIEGADLLLTCDVKGIPPPTIVWSRDDNEGNRRLGESDGEFSSNTVLIKNVGRHHTGKYYCYAFNSVNGSQAELLINVAGKPRVHVHKAVINSAINVEAILECSAHYENNPHIRWYKDGRLLEDTSSDYIISTLGSNSNLSVTPTKDADFGTYTCEAENRIGAHNRSISLVQRPVVEALDVDNARLTWTVHSHQPLQEVHAQLHQIDAQGDGEWKQYNIPLPASRTHKYNMIYDLNDKQLADGKYEVVIKVKNDHSWSDNTEPLIFEMNVIQPQSIQHASMFGGGASTIRLSSVALSTTIMYLLVRLL